LYKNNVLSLFLHTLFLKVWAERR